MNISEMTDLILKSYERYYDIRRDGAVMEPFVAEAIFHSHNEQYVFTKRATLYEQESNEYVFFASVTHLDAERTQLLASAAWAEGLSRVSAHSSHRNSDVTLVIVAETVSKEAISRIKKLHYYRSYRMGFQGWSAFRVIVLENSSGLLTYNRRGRELKKLYQKIVKL